MLKTKYLYQSFGALLISAGLVAKAFAVCPGLYLGVAAGPSINGASSRQAQLAVAPTTPPTTTTASPSSTQFGSRLMLGYMFTPYVGLESAATYFSTIHYDTNKPACGMMNAQVRDFELTGKGVMPVRQFNVFAKAGVALAYQSTSSALNPIAGDDCGKSMYTTNFVPALGIGVGYEMTRHWAADISASNVAVGGKIGNMTLFGLGVAYSFFDV